MADKMQEVHAALRTKHIRTLEVLQTVMEENEALKKKVQELEGNRGVAIDIEERKEIIAKARAESADMIKQLEAEAAARNKKIAELERALANMAESKENANASAKEVAALRKEVGALKEQGQIERAERDEAKSKCQECQTKVTETQSKLEAAEEYKSRKDLEIKKLMEQIQAASEEINNLTKERDQLKKSARKMSSAGDSALAAERACAEELERKNSELQALLEKLKSDNAELGSNLETTTSEKNAIKAEKDKIQKSRKEMRVELEALKEQLAAFGGAHDMLDELSRAKKALEEALAHEQEQRSNVEEVLQAERHGTEQLRIQNGQLQEELARLKNGRGNFGKFVKVKEENEKLKTELQKKTKGNMTKLKSAAAMAGKMKQMQPQDRPSQPFARRNSSNKR